MRLALALALTLVIGSTACVLETPLDEVDEPGHADELECGLVDGFEPNDETPARLEVLRGQPIAMGGARRQIQASIGGGGDVDRFELPIFDTWNISVSEIRASVLQQDVDVAFELGFRCDQGGGPHGCGYQRPSVDDGGVCPSIARPRGQVESAEIHVDCDGAAEDGVATLTVWSADGAGCGPYTLDVVLP